MPGSSATPAAEQATPENFAAVLVTNKARPLKVQPAPYPVPGPGQVVVRARAVAINPLDWILQRAGTSYMFSWIKYPFVIGADVAGDVVAVGPGVHRLQVGDRVLACAVSTDRRSNNPAEGAFQLYPVVREVLAAPIPAKMDYTRACVLPLALSTAACALYMKDQLALRHPTSDGADAVAARRAAIAATDPEFTQDHDDGEDQRESLLVWGASTSVGCNAVQLAVASGYRVVATASPRNFPLLRRLGASRTIDYNDSAAVAAVTSALGSRCAGAVAIGPGSAVACTTALAALPRGSATRRVVAQVSASGPATPPDSSAALARAIPAVLAEAIRLRAACLRGGVRCRFVWGTDLMANDVGPAVFAHFLPVALATGAFVPAPEPLVTDGQGLEALQDALDLQASGVSARKVVVAIP